MQIASVLSVRKWVGFNFTRQIIDMIVLLNFDHPFDTFPIKPSQIKSDSYKRFKCNLCKTKTKGFFSWHISGN